MRFPPRKIILASDLPKVQDIITELAKLLMLSQDFDLNLASLGWTPQERIQFKSNIALDMYKSLTRIERDLLGVHAWHSGRKPRIVHNQSLEIPRLYYRKRPVQISMSSMRRNIKKYELVRENTYEIFKISDSITEKLINLGWSHLEAYSITRNSYGVWNAIKALIRECYDYHDHNN